MEAGVCASAAAKESESSTERRIFIFRDSDEVNKGLDNQLNERFTGKFQYACKD
jgi:hypothetical protein